MYQDIEKEHFDILKSVMIVYSGRKYIYVLLQENSLTYPIKFLLSVISTSTPSLRPRWVGDTETVESGEKSIPFTYSNNR